MLKEVKYALADLAMIVIGFNTSMFVGLQGTVGGTSACPRRTACATARWARLPRP